MSTASGAVALASAIEQLLSALAQRRHVLGDKEPSPLSTFQAIALTVLDDEGPMRLFALAERLRTTNATASRTIDVLAGHGLAQRQSDPSDGRGVLVSATRSGHRFVLDRRSRLAALLEQLLAEMELDEAQRFTELLGELSDLLERHPPERS
jgi:DNA-binding MarR family transcriptional regulator